MNIDLKFENVARRALYKHLSKLNTMQFKTFYGLLVYCWANHKYFISNQNFFNLWCELNQLCHEFDESFPNQYNDHEHIKSFCHAHPYYFIDKLPLELVAKLFSEHINDRIEILTNIAKILFEEDIYAVYTYATKTLTLKESVDTLVSETLEHIKSFP